ncbi:GNAT family N-acetyltransferase [Flavobacterium sp.]|jgi:predicted GNAT family acetyltransferase|uniref:GNAT family N-acetyltransferase n=1 Tax=Flavobacterium sp. TaxID=239 RepID=UPI0037BE3D3C
MADKYESSELVKNEEKKRFELHVDTHFAFIEYILTNQNVMYLTHTEVPQALEGNGVGGSIVFKALNYIKSNHFTLAPLCPFVAAYVKRHPEWKEILASGYHV